MDVLVVSNNLKLYQSQQCNTVMSFYDQHVTNHSTSALGTSGLHHIQVMLLTQTDQGSIVELRYVSSSTTAWTTNHLQCTTFLRPCVTNN